MTLTWAQQALALLAQDYETLSYAQQDYLQLLTARAAGYRLNTGTVRARDKLWTVYYVVRPDGTAIENSQFSSDTQAWSVLPEYGVSVDACQTLPRPAGAVWLLTDDDTGPCHAELWHKPTSNQLVYQDAKTLPIAMLKCLWSTILGEKDRERE